MTVDSGNAANMAMDKQIVFRVEKPIRDWADALLEERPGSPGGKEKIGELMRLALINECKRRDPKEQKKPEEPKRED